MPPLTKITASTARIFCRTPTPRNHRAVTFNATDKINFEDHKSAFASKTTWEICRALAVLNICSFQRLVDNSEKWFEASQRVPIVRSLSTLLVRKTFYSQFVGGSRDEEIVSIVQRLIAVGVKPMLVCTMEEDIGEISKSQESLYDRNTERVLSCLNLAQRISSPSRPCVQLKMTSLFSPDLLERISRLFLVSNSKLSLVEPVAEIMRGNGYRSIAGVSKEDQKLLERGIDRLRTIGQVVAAEDGFRLLVDAEFSYVNPALRLLCLAMQATFNGPQPFIWNTYQCYLKLTRDYMEEDLDLASSLDVCFGVKLVRGAYLTSEQKWSRLTKQPLPVCSSYQDTNTNYDRCVERLVSLVKERPGRCAFVAATHNENSIQLLIKKMKEMEMEPGSKSINFAQLYGFSGYNVYKSIPVGPLHEAIPYLARRATENHSVLAGIRKEQQMLQRALRQRLTA